MLNEWEIKRTCKDPKFTVVVCCQGQPFYYQYHTLIGALVGFAYKYIKNKKYGTMNFSLKQYYRKYWTMNVSLRQYFGKMRKGEK